MKTTVISTFEGGYQPLTALTAGTTLQNQGCDVSLVDTYIEEFDLSRLAGTGLVAISVPLFDSLQSGVDLAAAIKAQQPQLPIAFFGQYATINERRLLERDADFVISGQWERPLQDLATNIRHGNFQASVPGIVSREDNTPPPTVGRKIDRAPFQRPNRLLAPALERYRQPQIDALLGSPQIVGGLEITRGCHHRCTYCSVYAAYDGKVILTTNDIAISDAAALVEQGMTHLTFTDAEFFNTRHQGIDVLRSLNQRFPDLTYDFTTRIDHIISNRDNFGELRSLGVRFITSALEFPKQRVLDAVAKEVTVDMINEAISILRNAAIKLNPTFIMFNPWVNLEDIFTLEDFIERNELREIVDPIQYETRLHLYKGSPLLENEMIRSLNLVERDFHFEWRHPDERMEELYAACVQPVVPGSFKRCCLKC